MSANLVLSDCVEFLEQQPDGKYAMVIGSPPYFGKTRRYPGGPKMNVYQWATFMAKVIKECVRCSRGFVWFVVNNPIQKGRYIPAIEILQVKLFEDGIMLDRPCIWWKNATPSRKGKYFSNDYEQVICAKDITYPEMNWEAIAEPPKYTAGGKFRQRSNDGGARPKEENRSEYPTVDLANPKDVFYCTVGGGHMGYDKADDELANKGKAPYPIKVASRFIQVGSSPGDLVFDPFIGSATTAASCLLHGREFEGTESNAGELEIGKRRLAALESRMPL